jgi:hypothetical protein
MTLFIAQLNGSIKVFVFSHIGHDCERIEQGFAISGIQKLDGVTPSHTKFRLSICG